MWFEEYFVFYIFCLLMFIVYTYYLYLKKWLILIDYTKYTKCVVCSFIFVLVFFFLYYRILIFKKKKIPMSKTKIIHTRTDNDLIEIKSKVRFYWMPIANYNAENWRKFYFSNCIYIIYGVPKTCTMFKTKKKWLFIEKFLIFPNISLMPNFVDGQLNAVKQEISKNSINKLKHCIEWKIYNF